MKSCLRALGSCVLALMLGVGVHADTIYMKNGSVIRGTVVGFQNGVFTVQIDAGPGGARSSATLANDEIDRIEFEAGGDADLGSASTPDAGYPDPYDNSTPSTSTEPEAETSRGSSGNPIPVSNTGDRADTVPADDYITRQAEVNVEPKADWTNSGLRVRKGTRVRIVASGTVQLDSSGRRVAGPGGVDVPDRDKLIANRPTGALVAVIGDDNDEFIYVGSQAEFVTERNGYLFLGVNEGNLTDNSGGFKVQLTVEKPPRENGAGGGGGGRKRDQNNKNGSIASQPSTTRPADPTPAPTNRTPTNPNSGRSGSNSAPPPSTAPADRGSSSRSGYPGAADPGENTDPVEATPDPAPSSGTRGTVLREADIAVQAALDWTNTKIRVQRGNRIRVSASGTVTLDKTGRYSSGPAGLNISDNDKLLQNRPTGALIAVIGDDNDEFIFVGQRTEFTATRDGILFLSVNEGNLRDNSGAYQAHVTVEQVQIEAPGATTGSAPRPATGGNAPQTTRPGQGSAGSASSTPLPKPVVDETMGAGTKPASPVTISANGGQADVTLQAKNDWTSTQLVVKKGSKIRVTASGTAKIDATGSAITPAGANRPDPHKLIPDKPTGALVAVIGDDNNEYIFIGAQTEFVAQRDGLLFLGINEGILSDNSGFFLVRVVVTPPRR